MLQYERIDVSEEIDLNNSDKTKKCIIFHFGILKTTTCL